MSSKDITFKIGNKKNVCVYGLQRFPVTLYADQWLELLKNTPQLLTFINENKKDLTFKDENDANEAIEMLDQVLNFTIEEN